MYEMILGELNISNECLSHLSKRNLKQRFGQFMNFYDAVKFTSDVFEQYLICANDCLPEVERFKMIEDYVTVNGLHDAGTPGDSGYAEADKVEDSDVGEIKDVMTSLSTFVGAIIPAEDEKLVNSKELWDVKHVDDTACF
ncbi:GL25104 [Drosophila persimilis]|uniref:GL25104 n=1 Tax=Drosophila persimilis TaxID=7234 RepID=B4GQV4_DROPE|nr:GL25104 [Drosophila persimilis]